MCCECCGECCAVCCGPDTRLIAMSIITCITGIVILATSGKLLSVVNTFNSTWNDLSKDLFGWAPMLSFLIVVGLLVIIMSILAVYAARWAPTRNIELFILIPYIIILLLLVIGMVVGNTYGLANIISDLEEKQESVSEELGRSFKSYDSDDSVRKTFQKLQYKFQCCGADKMSDYQTVLHWPPGVYAGSCCDEPDQDRCGRIDKYHGSPGERQGCGKKITWLIFVQYKLGMMIGGLSMTPIQLATAIVAINNIRTSE